MTKTIGVSPGGPLRRPGVRLLGRTPTESSVLTADDDEDEIGHRSQVQRRRRESVLAHNSSAASPTSSPGRANRRQSCFQPVQRPLNNMSHAQLSDHYSNCIKLSTENKINAKNAFALHLIDYMADMLVSQGQQTMCNFQVASCSLDASSKIYSTRVDIIHKETYNIASELCRTNKPHRGKGGDAEEDEEDPQEGGADCRVPQKKRRKKSQNVASDPKALISDKVDLQFEVDPLFHKTTELFAKGGGCGVFLSQLFSENDSVRMVLNSTHKSLDKSAHKVDTSTLEQLKLPDIYPLKICNAFADFNFENWTPGEQQQHNFSMFGTPPPCNGPNVDEDFGGGDDGGGCFDGGDVLGGDSDRGHADQVSAANGAENGHSDLNINSDVVVTSNNLTSILSTVPSEYSYFREDRLSAWAGPNHWKVVPKSRSTSDAASRLNREPRSRPKKVNFFVDFTLEVEVSDVFKKSKVATALTARAMAKWSQEANTLPEDHHFEAKLLYTLTLLPLTTLEPKKENNVPKPVAGETVEDYNYQNPNDVDNFCPAADQASSSDYQDCDNDSNFADADHSAGENAEMVCFAGDNLLAPPKKVARFEMPQLKSAKRIDVKKLKYSMWNLMTVEEENAHESSHRTVGNRTIVTEKFFSNLYQNLPATISAEMNKDLSVQIAFFCLLDLSNEKGLRLKGQEDLKDISILMAD